MQGVIKAYDPDTASASSCATPIWPTTTWPPTRWTGSLFRMLRQGQRVIFDLDDTGRATHLRLGSEVDMGTPGLLTATGHLQR